MKVSLYRSTTVRDWATSTNATVVKLSDGDLTDGVYHIRVEWLSGNSCDTYAMKIGDGCCSAECSVAACGSCGTDCPNF